MVAKYVFISYEKLEYDLAVYIANILQERLVEGISVFIAKRDIKHGDNPLKVMLEEQLLQAEALVALCSERSKSSPWICWESATVWARGGLVVPLFIKISPNEFNGPITLICQGGDFFEVINLNSTLQAITNKVCPDHPCKDLTSEEIKKLEQLKSK